MTTAFIIIDKNGILKPQHSRALTKECLYKKCGFRTSEGFEKLYTWSNVLTNTHTVELWGKQNIKCLENAYNFSFLDIKKYYGTLAIIAVDNTNNIVDITLDEWNNIYNIISEVKNDEDPVEYESDEPEDNKIELSSGSELEEEEYYYSDNEK